MEELTKSDLDQQDPEKQELTNQKVEYSNIDSLQQYKTQVASMITKNFNHIVGNQVESENENLNINIHSVFKEVSMNIKPPKIKLKSIWRSIMELEKEHTDKKLIALALLCIYIAGDNELSKASENRISKNGYSKFINDILTII